MAAIETAAGSRSDARRNRERLVSAARELFASAGVDVSTREVARHAGVGVGTLYRHFPAREDLVDAVLGEAFDELIGLAKTALAEADAWRGFTRFVEEALVLHARNRALMDVVETQKHGRERAISMRRRIRPLVAQLIARAHADGSLRPDRVIELGRDVAPEIWRRHLGFVFDGLRSGAATPLPRGPLTDTQLKRVGQTRRGATA